MAMREEEIHKLRDEVKELRKTVKSLTSTIDELKNQVASHKMDEQVGDYQIFKQSYSVEGDISWDRLVSILKKTEVGKTAKELARVWGKSRSRTSEVLNHLVEEGRLVKVRDGRKIRFRTAE